MRYTDREPSKPKGRTQYVLRFSSLKSNAPKNWTKGGEYTYYERQVAIRDKHFYSRFYNEVEGPFPFFENNNRHENYK